MKNFFTLLFCALLFSSVQAQFVISPSIIEEHVDMKVERLVYIPIQNLSSSTENVHWELVKESSMPNEKFWKVFMCDKHLCYSPKALKNAGSMPSNFAPNESFDFILHIQVDSIPGFHHFHINFYRDAAHTDTIFSMNSAGYITTGPVSTQESELSAIQIYPNPVSETFSLTNAIDVKSVLLYDMLGKKLKQYVQNTNEEYDISNLNSGVYFVQAMDENKKVLKTLRLVKQ